MTDENEPDDREPSAELTVAAGAPVRVVEWLVLPVVLIVGAIGCLVFAPAVSASAGHIGYIRVTAALVLIAAGAQAFLGRRAFSELTGAAVARYRLSVIATLLSLGLLTLFGTLPSGLLLFAAAGYGASSLEVAAVRAAQAWLTAPGWHRLAVATGCLATAMILGRPVAYGLGGVPLGATVAGASVAAGFVAAFAFRMRLPDRADV